MEHVGRRTVVGLALAAGAGLAAACQSDDEVLHQDGPGGTDTPAPAVTRRQAGVDTPLPRQRYAVVSVLTLADVGAAQATLRRLGEAVLDVAQTDGVTVTVGVGPAVVRSARGAGFVGAEDLATFESDRIEDGARGGDLLLQVCADRKSTTRSVTDDLVTAIGRAARTSWSIDGYRGEVDGVGARNLLGFYDGVAVPTEPAEIDADVWTDESDGLADATICVLRRIRLDHRRFASLPVTEQEAVLGRHKRSGAPLSGGGSTADVDLQARSDDGVFDIANDAHVRRAHPLFSGARKLMMRRGYSYRAAPDDQGLAFICFQRELQMFVRTQNSMDGGDRLLTFATTTGTGSFLVLPMWTRAEPLGATLFA
ncbi:hypothetical protein BH11ACT8_BH11ACT8_28110 [soil metagenome]